MSPDEYLKARGWRYEFDNSGYFTVFDRWIKDGHNVTQATALWIEWQDLAQCFAECVVAFRLSCIAGNQLAVDNLMKAALNKHGIDIKIKEPS